MSKLSGPSRVLYELGGDVSQDQGGTIQGVHPRGYHPGGNTQGGPLRRGTLQGEYPRGVPSRRGALQGGTGNTKTNVLYDTFPFPFPFPPGDGIGTTSCDWKNPKNLNTEFGQITSWGRDRDHLRGLEKPKEFKH